MGDMTDRHDADHALRAMADAAAADVKGDFPGSDVNYDLYVDEVNMRLWGKTRTWLIGVIDMGELFQAAFVWERDHWTLLDGNPVEMRDTIVAHRSS